MDKKENNTNAACGHNELETCPECGKKNVRVDEIEYRFPYGVGKDRVELSAVVAARTCPDCGFTFLDSIAQEKCHEAICRHLGVMSPSQIRALRDFHSLSQAQFADVTKLGVATLSRWERGIFVQNQAYDNYLFLLGFPENLERIRKRGAQGSGGEGTKSNTTPEFKRLEITPELRMRQSRFKLHTRHTEEEKVLCT